MTIGRTNKGVVKKAGENKTGDKSTEVHTTNDQTPAVRSTGFIFICKAASSYVHALQMSRAGASEHRYQLTVLLVTEVSWDTDCTDLLFTKFCAPSALHVRGGSLHPWSLALIDCLFILY
jgi:hypothetical protein